MRLLYAYVAFVSFLAISAQEALDAELLLSQRSSALKKYYSYQYVETMSMGSMSSTTTVQAVNPDKYRMVTKTVSGEGPAIDGLKIVADGRTIWKYSATSGKYSKKPVPVAPEGPRRRVLFRSPQRTRRTSCGRRIR
jgi:outer membrane lipoprotein-sorting protein